MRTPRQFIQLVSLPLLALAVLANADQKQCELALSGARFLHRRSPDLFRSPAVTRAVAQAERSGPPLTQPTRKIAAWMKTIEARTELGRNDRRRARLIKEWFHRRFVTKAAKISESYFELQRRLRREQGHGDVEFGAEERARMAAIAERDQINSLDQWIEYLMDKDSDRYATWFKYWVMMGVVNLSKFNPETLAFQNRSRGQALPFPELNRAALGKLADWVTKNLVGDLPPDAAFPEVRALLKDPNFGKLYARAWAEEMGAVRDLTETRGTWIKYDRGSDPQKLVDSIRGMNTGWCTVGLSTAEDQLESGDFYVYYSQDSNGAPVVPRLAIRFSNGEIAEVRGVGPQQEIDSKISETNILSGKLREFGPTGAAYLKRSSDMRRLTRIERKLRSSATLTPEDLRFLYEIDGRIEGFGYEEDPRIEELRSNRDVKQDLSLALKVTPEAISTKRDEAFIPGIEFHWLIFRSPLTPAKNIGFRPSSAEIFIYLARTSWTARSSPYPCA